MIMEANYGGKFHDDDAPKVTRVINNAIYTRQITSDQVHEFQVPTCSYRMGTNEIGYGFAVIGKKIIITCLFFHNSLFTGKTQVQYTVLWTPSRLLQLKIYGYMSLFFFIWFMCIGFCSKRRYLKSVNTIL